MKTMERLHELIGKTLTKVENKDNKVIIFTCEDGKQYKNVSRTGLLRMCIY